MRFGIFLPPHHVPVGQNPTWSLQRDVELVQLLDRMGFDEADAITQIERLQEQSQGGFGAYLMFAHNWAPWEETQHHYHLFANHVMPVFKKTTTRLLANEAWTRSVRDPLAAKQWDAINAFTAKHQAEQDARAQGSMS